MLTRTTLACLGLIFFASSGYSQCPGGRSCNNAPVFCSAGQLNGFSCTTNSTPNASFPLPNLCFGVGQPQNIQWWSFIGNGGVISIKFNFDKALCSQQRGIQGGVMESSCDGGAVWGCNASCNGTSFTLNGATTPCELYQIWVDGCQGDICPFTIEVSGNTGAPSLPTIPPLTTRDPICHCGEMRICAPDLGECQPTYQWHVDGVGMGRDDCIEVSFPENANEGDHITVCLTATIGNPDIPSLICDQKMRCTDFTLGEIEQIFENCELVCHEDHPFTWQGVPVFSSCIVPPCSARIEKSNGCCADIFKPIVIHPESQVGLKDTFICDSQDFLAENNWAYDGEVCLELVEFKQRIINRACPTSIQRCDTSYQLRIARLNYSRNWTTSCDSTKNQLNLSANIRHETQCSEFINAVEIRLEWYNQETKQIIDTTSKDASIIVANPGTYCVNVQGIYRGISCISPNIECFEITEEMLHQTSIIEGDARVCFDSTTEFSFQTDSAIQEFNWIIKGQGIFIGPKDTSVIAVQWDSLEMDTSQVCLEIKTECSKYELCKQVLICHKTTSSNLIPNGEMHYSFPTQQIIWKDLNSNIDKNRLTIYNIQGQPVINKSIPDSGQLDIESLIKGIYFIHIYNTENTTRMTKKIMR